MIQQRERFRAKRNRSLCCILVAIYNLSIIRCTMYHIPFFSMCSIFAMLLNTFKAWVLCFIWRLANQYNTNVVKRLNATTMYNCISIEAPNLYEMNHAATMRQFSDRIEMVVPMCEKPKSMNMWCRCVLSG